MNELFKEISSLDTEQINPNTKDIDILPISECLKLINNEDKLVAKSIENVLPVVEEAVKIVIDAFKVGGRLIYVGAGTSGRLGILDASECPPTFGSNPEMVQGLIAGGMDAIFVAQEGAEDSKDLARQDLKNIRFNDVDILCGLAASGRTPYVLGAIDFAKEVGAKSILVTTTKKEKIKSSPDILVSADVGPEVIMGSTRMKSGTAQKMILNMITTLAFVKMGKTYNNIMIDLQMTNQKLVERAKRTIMTITDISYDEAEKYLELAGNHVKLAILMILKGCTAQEGRELLEKANGFVKLALKSYTN